MNYWSWKQLLALKSTVLLCLLALVLTFGSQNAAAEERGAVCPDAPPDVYVTVSSNDVTLMWTGDWTNAAYYVFEGGSDPYFTPDGVDGFLFEDPYIYQDAAGLTGGMAFYIVELEACSLQARVGAVRFPLVPGS